MGVHGIGGDRSFRDPTDRPTDAPGSVRYRGDLVPSVGPFRGNRRPSNLSKHDWVRGTKILRFRNSPHSQDLTEIFGGLERVGYATDDGPYMTEMIVRDNQLPK